MQRQIRAIIPVFLVFFSSLSIWLAACNSIDERYFERLDSLDNRLDTITAMLQVDGQTIERRKELIEGHIRLVQLHYNDTFSPEFGTFLSKYKGVGKAYKKFTADYSNCLTELESLKKQAADLRQSVEAGTISKDAFKQYYATETADGIALYNRSKNIIDPVHSVEPDYQRISRLVHEKLSEKAKENPDLDSALKDLAQ
ncbi:MAG: hypothetical protein H6608_03210 [Flavobacteriales bacterium]|nr:hypothetical protein [Bacteroidota bacterium]MCB9240113.1 hypothetical protein [Flavobacteriales bacterium]